MLTNLATCRPGLCRILLIFCIGVLMSCASDVDNSPAPVLSLAEHLTAAASNHPNSLLQQAWSALDQDQPEIAIDIIATFDKQANPLSDQIAAEVYLLQARLLLSRRPQQATEQLARALALLPPGDKIADLALKYKAFNTQIAVYEATRDSAKLASTWLSALRWLPSTAQEEATSAAWSALQTVTPDKLAALVQDTADSGLKGWYQLTLESYHLLAAEKQYQAYLAWRADWPTHRAARQPPKALRLLPELIRQQPRRVAVLLPVSGPLSLAGKTIRDGLVAAHFQRSPANRAHFSFFNTGEMDIEDAYRQAIGEGAQFVIGPLNKTSLPRLLELVDEKVPVLALNYLPTEEEIVLPETLYQFGLSVETEIAQIIERARLEAGSRAIIIHANTTWGNRHTQLIAEGWHRAGGEVLATVVIDQPKEAVDKIAAVLDIEASTQRAKKISRLSNRRVEFRPRRRQDIDLIFLVANYEIASAIKPALAYHFAERLPVYATSRAIPSDSDTVIYSDLTGIRYCDLPWRIHPYNLTARSSQTQTTTSSALFALGLDAAGLLTRIQQFRQNGQLKLNGATGQLSLTADRRFHRRLSWAQIVSGIPVPLAPPTPMDTRPDK